MSQSVIKDQLQFSDIFKFNSIQTGITSSNIDTFTKSGIYQCWFDNGVPYTKSWGVLIVTHDYEFVIEQIVINQGGVAKRHWENNTWTEWKKVAFT